MDMMISKREKKTKIMRYLKEGKKYNLENKITLNMFTDIMVQL